MENEDNRAEVTLRGALEQLAVSCAKYVAISKNNSLGPGSGKTKLDKERIKLCEREVVCVVARSNDANLSDENVR